MEKISTKRVVTGFERETVSRIFRQLGAEIESFSFLASGNHKRNYRVETSRGIFVLRIQEDERFKNLKKEYAVLRSLPVGMGPEVFAFDDKHRELAQDYLVEELIQGTHPEKVDKALLSGMAEWFKKLHAIMLEAETIQSPSVTLEPYADNVKKYGKYSLPGTREEIDIMVGKAREWMRENSRMFSAERPCMLHRDPSRGNILLTDQGIRLIDWEFAEPGPPEWDLAYFIQSFELDAEQTRLFLEEYGYPKDEAHDKRMLTIQLLDTCGALGYSLWSLELMARGEMEKGEEEEMTRKRLARDTALLKKLLEQVK